MKRLRTWLWLTLTITSALLCAATCTLWARSYWGSDYVARRWMTDADEVSISHQDQQIEWTSGQVRWVLGLDTYYHHGQANVALTPGTMRPQWSCGRLGKGHVYWASPPPQNVWNRMGFAT